MIRRCFTLAVLHFTQKLALGNSDVVPAYAAGCSFSLLQKLSKSSEILAESQPKPGSVVKVGPAPAQQLSASDYVSSGTLFAIVLVFILLAVVGAATYHSLQSSTADVLESKAECKPSEVHSSSSASVNSEAEGKNAPNRDLRKAKLSKGSFRDSLVLCGTGLLVPPGNECLLVLPSLVEKSDEEKFFVSDMNSISIFSVVYHREAQADGTRLVLTSKSGEQIFCFCRAMTSFGGAVSMAIHSKNFESTAFGVIRLRTDKTIELVTSQKKCLRFQGDWNECFDIIDEEGLTLVLSEKLTGVRHLRIGPNVDAGLVVLAYLATDVLRMDTGQ